MFFIAYYRFVFYVQALCMFFIVDNVDAYNQVYKDITKSILKIKNVIEDLIKNYEHSQKKYEFDDKHSSSLEINEAHNIVSSYKQIKQRNRSYNKTKTKYTTELPVTAIIYDSELSEQKIENSEETIESTVKKQLVIEPNNKEKKQKAENDQFTENKDSKDTEEIPLEKAIKNYIKMPQLKQTTTKRDKKYNGLQTYRIKHNIYGKKTRFSVLKLVPKDSPKKSNNPNKFIYPSRAGDSRRLYKIVHPGIFSLKNIWQRVIKKLIEIQRGGDEITGSINNLSTKNNAIKRSQNSLLKQYGETCLQVPIKRCRKAIKAVNKKVCKARFKCKSDFKSDFIENGNAGCKKEFSFKLNNASRDKEVENIKSLLVVNRNYANILKYKPNKALPALRDKYERECQKVSREKCNNACIYGLDETCSTHKCNSRQKKAFKQACKEECKNLFIIEDTDSDSDSDSDGDSDSDSDSEDSGSD